MSPDGRARLARLHRRLRTSGPRATLAKLARDHLFKRTASVVLESYPDWGQASAGDRRPAWLACVTVRDPAALPPLGDWLQPRRADFARMLADGKIAMFALRDGVAVGCAWFALADHRDAGAREFYRVAPGETYHYCWLVDPAWRGSVTLPMGRYMLAALRELGIDRRFGVIDRANRASYRVLTRYGYRECGIGVTHLTLLGTRWTWTSRYRGTLGLLEPAKPRR